MSEDITELVQMMDKIKNNRDKFHRNVLITVIVITGVIISLIL